MAEMNSDQGLVNTMFGAGTAAAVMYGMASQGSERKPQSEVMGEAVTVAKDGTPK